MTEVNHDCKKLHKTFTSTVYRTMADFQTHGEAASVESSIYDEDGGIISSEFMEPSLHGDTIDEVEEVHKMAHRETIGVRVWKLLLVGTLVTTAALVSTGTYVLLEQEEEDDFKENVSVASCESETKPPLAADIPRCPSLILTSQTSFLFPHPTVQYLCQKRRRYILCPCGRSLLGVPVHVQLVLCGFESDW
jgi:hypothetical protein